MSSTVTNVDKISDKPKVEKKKLIKVVLRRLPFGLSEQELLEQLSPLPQYETFWFIKADLDLLPFAFSRAYIVFKEELDAIQFRDRFNGYVFIDKLGNESVGIVEQAPYQEYPKDKREHAKDNDKNCATLEEHPDYLKFLDEYNSLGSKKVTNFDELIKEIEQKDKMLKKGFVKETPLTDYLYKLAMEKAQRRFGRRGGKSGKVGKWTEEKKPAKEVLRRKDKEKKPKPENKSKLVTKDRGNKQDPKNTDKHPSKPIDKMPVKPTKGKVEEKSLEKPIKIMKREDSKVKEQSPKEALLVKDKENEPKEDKKIYENKPDVGKINEQKSEDSKPVQPKRNKDRPERQIYQPRARKAVIEKPNGPARPETKSDANKVT